LYLQVFKGSKYPGVVLISVNNLDIQLLYLHFTVISAKKKHLRKSSATQLRINNYYHIIIYMLETCSCNEYYNIFTCFLYYSEFWVRKL